MKYLFAVALTLAAGTAAARNVPVHDLAAWDAVDVADVTQAWYFTEAALSGQQREGSPWAGDRIVLRPADIALAPPVHTASADVAEATVAPPPTVPEPSMVSMLLVGLALIFLSVGTERHEGFKR